MFGNLRFLTPIIELPVDQVTGDEAEGYRRFREGYQRNWRQVFDPIALRLEVRDDHLAADLTVMPLIAGTEYRQYIALVGSRKLAPNAGDRHPEAMFHFVTAIDRSATEFQRAEQFLAFLGGGALGWLGGSIAVYADEDPFWSDLLKAPDRDKFLTAQFHRLPVGIHFEVADPLKLALFLTGLRAFIEQTAPGLTRFESREYAGHKYVRIGATEAAGSQVGIAEPDRLGLFYASTPRSFLLAIDESVVRRFFDRNAATNKDGALHRESAALPAWLGEHLGVHVGNRGMFTFASSIEEETERAARERCWRFLPLLNEWRSRFPEHDPVVLIERFVGAPVTSRQFGSFQWNESWQTMESTELGHPNDPRQVDPSRIFESASQFDFGITFENGGLRARSRIGLKPPAR